MSELLDRAEAEFEDLSDAGYLGRNASPRSTEKSASACLPAIGIRLPAVAADLAAAVFSRIDDPPSAAAGRLPSPAGHDQHRYGEHWNDTGRLRPTIAEVTGDDQVAAGSAFWAAFMAALEDPTRERIDALIDIQPSPARDR